MDEYNIEYRFQNFILFEPASLRVSDSDVLYRGFEVVDVVEEITSDLMANDSLANLIVKNRLDKIKKMLDLVTDYDQLVVTRFLDRIWRRYAYLSNLGEVFLDLKTFYGIFPDQRDAQDAVVADRFDCQDPDMLGEQDDDDEDDESDEADEDKKP